jgi:nucleolar protein 6
MRIKEVMVNMPDNLDTKKEVDEYYKNAMKDIKEKNKENKKEKKAEPKKRAKKVEVDDEGNEIVKVKRPLNKYQKFIQDNRKKVKEENPDMSGEEIFTLIAELWGKHKEDIKNGVINDDDDKKDTDDDSESDKDIKKEKKEKKEKAPKKEKTVKKAKKESS